MKKKRIPLVIRSIPSDYQPRYPSTLTEDQHRELVRESNQNRLARVLLSAPLAFGASGAQDEAPETESLRETRIRELLSSLDATRDWNGMWFRQTTYSRTKREGGKEHVQILPVIPISYGNSYSGIFDVGRARKLAAQAFRAYGLDPRARDVAAEGHVAKIDGVDQKTKIGFEIRLPDKAEGFLGAKLPTEPASERLTSEGLDALEREGYELHVVDGEQYPVMDGDSFTTELAYLAGIVDFLNAVTDGPDVDLGAVLYGEFAGWTPHAAGKVTCSKGGKVTAKDGTLRAYMPRGGKVTLRLDPTDLLVLPESDEKPRYWNRDTLVPATRAVSTEGRICVVCVDVVLERPEKEGVRPKVCVLQEEDGEAKATKVTSRSGKVFLPTRFDAARSFEIELELGVGVWRIEDFVLLKGVR